MRRKELFTVFPRSMKSGKVIYYYRTYDTNGKRTIARSTGQTTKTAARAYCNLLNKEDKLIPSKITTFEEYSRNWWIYNKCSYIQSKLKRGYQFAHSTADSNYLCLKNHILPQFGPYKLETITDMMIEEWLFSIGNEKGLKNKTVNCIYSVLKIMMKEAYKRKLINMNPVANIKPLKDDSKKKSILSIKEVQTIFEYENLKEIWGKVDYYTANLLSCFTAIRQGEVLALRAENVHKDNIVICHSWDRKYGLKSTKTNDTRIIPISPFLSSLLKIQLNKNPSGYLFSNNGGESPIHYRQLVKSLYKAFSKIGINEDERKERNISFHSWRHFFNSTNRGIIPDHLLQRITGHKTQEMTEHYTHPSLDDLKDILSFQKSIIPFEGVV